MFEEITGIEPKRFSAIEGLNRTFKSINGNFGWLVLASLIVFVVQIVLSFIPIPILMFILILAATPLTAGLIKMSIDSADNKQVELVSLFQTYKHAGAVISSSLLMWMPYVAAYGIIMITLAGSSGFFDPEMGPNGVPDFSTLLGPIIFVFLGFALLAIVLNVFFFFVFHLIVDKNYGPFEAIKMSARSATSNPVQTLIMVIIWTVIIAIGLAMCYVGFIATYPLAILFGTMCYRQIFPSDETPVIKETAPPTPDQYRDMVT